MNPYLTPTIRQRRNRGDFGQRGTVRHAERISFERRHGAATPAPLTRRQPVLIVIVWCAVMGATLWLCTDAGMAFLAALWGAK
jgi:hypothetical protein